MAPILFKIPITIPFFWHGEIPVYGFGVMLVLAFFAAPWLAWWRSRREGLDPSVIAAIRIALLRKNRPLPEPRFSSPNATSAASSPVQAA